MVSGHVNSDLEPIVSLEIIGSSQQRLIEVVVDTGFSGFLSLPSQAIEELGLTSCGRREIQLGDGTEIMCDAFLATLLWHDREAECIVLDAGPDALLGTHLLEGSRVDVGFFVGGSVRIEELGAA